MQTIKASSTAVIDHVFDQAIFGLALQPRSFTELWDFVRSSCGDPTVTLDDFHEALVDGILANFIDDRGDGDRFSLTYDGYKYWDGEVPLN